MIFFPVQKIRAMNTGINALRTLLRQLAAYNRTNEMFVVIEYTENKFDKTRVDAHVRTAFSTSDEHQKLIWPKDIKRVIYSVGKDIKDDYRVYYFCSSPTSLKVSDEATKEITRTYLSGRFGFYWAYTWNDIEVDSSLNDDIEL